MGGSLPRTASLSLTPHFPSNDPHRFVIVHKVFGASNVSKMLQELAAHQRADGVSSLVYEANARMRDPVYVRVRAISYLQSQVSQLQMQSAVAQAEILKVQMQQDSRVRGLVHSHIETADEKCLSFVSNDITSNVQQYFNCGLSLQYCNREPSQLNERVPLEINFPLQSHPFIKS